MATLITVFVAFQLVLGFCALLAAMRQSHSVTLDASDFCRIKVRRE